MCCFTRRTATAEQKPALAVQPIEPATLQAPMEAKPRDQRAGLRQNVEGEREVPNLQRGVSALQRQLEMR